MENYLPSGVANDLPTVVEFHLPTVVEDERERDKQSPPGSSPSAMGGGYSPSAAGGDSLPRGGLLLLCAKKPLLTHCSSFLHLGRIAAELTLRRQTVVTQNYSQFTT